MRGPTLAVARATARASLSRAPLPVAISAQRPACSNAAMPRLYEAILGPCPKPAHHGPQIGPELFLILSHY
jgi:hypothetical protein